MTCHVDMKAIDDAIATMSHDELVENARMRLYQKALSLNSSKRYCNSENGREKNKKSALRSYYKKNNLYHPELNIQGEIERKYKRSNMPKIKKTKITIEQYTQKLGLHGGYIYLNEHNCPLWADTHKPVRRPEKETLPTNRFDERWNDPASLPRDLKALPTGKTYLFCFNVPSSGPYAITDVDSETFDTDQPNLCKTLNNVKRPCWKSRNKRLPHILHANPKVRKNTWQCKTHDLLVGGNVWVKPNEKVYKASKAPSDEGIVEYYKKEYTKYKSKKSARKSRKYVPRPKLTKTLSKEAFIDLFKCINVDRYQKAWEWGWIAWVCQQHFDEKDGKEVFNTISKMDVETYCQTHSASNLNGKKACDWYYDDVSVNFGKQLNWPLTVKKFCEWAKDDNSSKYSYWEEKYGYDFYKRPAYMPFDKAYLFDLCAKARNCQNDTEFPDRYDRAVNKCLNYVQQFWKTVKGKRYRYLYVDYDADPLNKRFVEITPCKDEKTFHANMDEFIVGKRKNRNIYLSQVYKEWPGKEKYEGFINKIEPVKEYQPLSNDNYLNEYTGLRFEYDPEFKVDMTKVQKFLDFTHKIVCGGRMEICNYILKWCKKLFSGHVTGVAIMLYGSKRCGKGTFVKFLKTLLTPANFYETNDLDKCVKGTRAGGSDKQVALAQLIFFDEAFKKRNYADRRDIIQKWKNYTTTETVRVRLLFNEPCEAKCRRNAIINCNDPSDLPIEATNFRNLMLEISKDRQNDTDYFDDLNEYYGMDMQDTDDFRNSKQNENLIHVFHHIMNQDITKFGPQKDLPKTTETEFAKRKCVSVLDQFMYRFVSNVPSQMTWMSYKEIYGKYEKFVKETDLVGVINCQKDLTNRIKKDHNLRKFFNPKKSSIMGFSLPNDTQRKEILEMYSLYDFSELVFFE